MENRSAATKHIPEERWYCAECGVQTPELHGLALSLACGKKGNLIHLWDGRKLAWCSPQCLDIMTSRCSGELVSVRGTHGPRSVP